MKLFCTDAELPSPATKPVHESLHVPIADSSGRMAFGAFSTAEEVAAAYGKDLSNKVALGVLKGHRLKGNELARTRNPRAAFSPTCHQPVYQWG